MEKEAFVRVLQSDGDEANLSDLFVGDEFQCAVLAEVLQQGNVHKSSLVLRGNHISSDGIVRLSDALKGDHMISELSLEWNNIGTFDHGVEALANVLEVNRTLEKLDLRNNSVSATGAKALARALRSNSTLKALDLRWNEIGTDGGRAFRDLLDTNSTLSDLQLSGNQVEDALLENLEAAVADRDSRLAAHVSLKDDLHTARERADTLEARLRKQMRQEEELRREESSAEQKWQLELAARREESIAIKAESDRQLQASAQQVAQMEEEVIHERAKVVDLTDKLEKAVEKGKDLADNLERTKETAMETKRELSRQLEKLTLSVDSANEDRRTTQRELEHIREVLEKEIEEVKEENRKLSVENDALKRAARREAAIHEQAHANLETSAAEVRLLKERIDEHSGMLSKAAADGKAQVEDTRRMYEERIEAVKRDCDTRIRAADERAKESEYERQRAETSRQAAHRDLTKLQVHVEDKLSEHERRAAGDAQKKFDLELSELNERLETVQKARDLQATAVKDQMAVLEDLRSSSALELREYGNELVKLRASLESAHETSRQHEGRTSRLQTDLNVATRKFENAQAKVDELERDRAHMADVQSTNMDKLLLQHSLELKASERQVTETRALVAKLESQLREREEDLTTQRQQHQHSLNALEKGVSASLAEAFHSARSREQFVVQQQAMSS